MLCPYPFQERLSAGKLVRKKTASAASPRSWIVVHDIETKGRLSEEELIITSSDCKQL